MGLHRPSIGPPSPVSSIKETGKLSIGVSWRFPFCESHQVRIPPASFFPPRSFPPPPSIGSPVLIPPGSLMSLDFINNGRCIFFIIISLSFWLGFGVGGGGNETVLMAHAVKGFGAALPDCSFLLLLLTFENGNLLACARLVPPRSIVRPCHSSQICLFSTFFSLFFLN